MESAILTQCVLLEHLAKEVKTNKPSPGSAEETAIKDAVVKCDTLCITLTSLGCCPCDDPNCQKQIAALSKPKQFIVIVTVATLIAAGIGALIGHYTSVKAVTSTAEKAALNQLMQCRDNFKGCC